MGSSRQCAIKRKAARRIRGLLNVEPTIEHAAQDLHMSRRLVLSTHHAKGHDRLAVLRQQTRNDGVKGTLSRRNGIGMSFEKGESRTPVLQ